MAVQFTGGRVRFFNNIADGPIEPARNGYVYSYDAGTSNPKDTYSTSAGDVANTNPILLDAEGYANIFLGAGNYKIDVRDENDNSLPGYPVDNIEGTINLLDTITAASTTSVSIGTGTKSFMIPPNKSFPPDGWVLITDNANTVNTMVGRVSDYTGDTIQIDVSQFTGSGFSNDWSIALSGPPGPQGMDGSAGAGTGDMLKSENLAGLTDVPTARGNLGLGSGAVEDSGTGPDQVLKLDSAGNLPAVDGSAVTNISADNVAIGTISTDRLGSGTANSGTFLRGDGAWAVPSVVSFLGVGSFFLATAVRGGTGNLPAAPGATISGSRLRAITLSANTNAEVINGGNTIPGTWLNMSRSTIEFSGTSVDNFTYGLFQRVT